MGTKFIELQVKAFIDQDDKKWEHVKVKTAESDLTIRKARAESAWHIGFLWR